MLCALPNSHAVWDTMPCGIPCRAGYHAVRDTMPHRYFQTTTGDNQVFSSFHAATIAEAGVAVCRESFSLSNYTGPAAAPGGVLRTNVEYGGAVPIPHSMVLCTASYGMWHGIGIMHRIGSHGVPHGMVGRDLAGTNITIPNGSMDPWHALAILNATFDPFSSPTEHLTPSERAVFIQDTAHCRRPRPFSPLLTPSP